MSSAQQMKYECFEVDDKEVLNRLQMYGNGYSMAIVLDHRSTATSLTGNHPGIKTVLRRMMKQ